MDNVANLRRLRVITHHAPLIQESNWSALSDQGWHWKINVKLEEYTVAVQTIKKFQTEHGRDSVTVGHPFDRNEHKPREDDLLIGIYVHDICKLVFSLQRDLAKWEKLTQKEIEDL